MEPLTRFCYARWGISLASLSSHRNTRGESKDLKGCKETGVVDIRLNRQEAKARPTPPDTKVVASELDRFLQLREEIKTRAVIVERVSPELAKEGECNTNNHKKEEIPAEQAEAEKLDYNKELSKVDLECYMREIGYPVEWQFTFSSPEVATLRRTGLGACLIGDFPKPDRDELMEIVNRLETQWKMGEWFCRSGEVSGKDGVGAYPLTSAEDTIRKFVTSHRFRSSLGRVGLGDVTLHFVRWDATWDPEREIRGFVRRGRLTALSQYVWHRRGMLSTLNDDGLTRVARKAAELIEFKYSKLPQKLKTQDFVVDFYLADETEEKEKLRIVELNPFGYWQASGSALFHWIRDYERLYGISSSPTLQTQGAPIYFRVLQ